MHERIFVLVQDVIIQRGIPQSLVVEGNGLLISFMVLLQQHSCHCVLRGKLEDEEIFGEIFGCEDRCLGYVPLYSLEGLSIFRCPPDLLVFSYHVNIYLTISTNATINLLRKFTFPMND